MKHIKFTYEDAVIFSTSRSNSGSPDFGLPSGLGDPTGRRFANTRRCITSSTGASGQSVYFEESSPLLNAFIRSSDMVKPL